MAKPPKDHLIEQTKRCLEESEKLLKEQEVALKELTETITRSCAMLKSHAATRKARSFSGKLAWPRKL